MSIHKTYTIYKYLLARYTVLKTEHRIHLIHLSHGKSTKTDVIVNTTKGSIMMMNNNDQPIMMYKVYYESLLNFRNL